jgi:hypothetical protein
MAHTTGKECEAIWTTVEPLRMPVLSENQYQKSAEEFFDKWNFHDCIGYTDCKHISVKSF